MSLLLAMLVGISGAPAADMPVINPKAGQPANCPATSRYEASRRGKRSLKARPLDELPDADVYRAVYRRIGRCEVPMIVKYGVTGR
jgi:hypothetical protein